MTVLLVALGAAVGAPLRYLIDRAVRSRHGSAFPWGTLVVNVAGSLVLGFVVGLPMPAGWQAVLGTGFCGALTTYSTFGFETVGLARAGRRWPAVGNVLVSVLAGLGAAYLGLIAAGAVAQVRRGPGRRPGPPRAAGTPGITRPRGRPPVYSFVA